MSSPALDRTARLDLDGSWAIGGKIHGGYLLSEIARAALGLLGDGHPHPLAVSAMFVSAPDPGPAELAVEVLRRGRSVSSLRARLSQGDAVRTEVLLTAGTLPTAGEALWVAPTGAPELPPVEDCPARAGAAPGRGPHRPPRPRRPAARPGDDRLGGRPPRARRRTPRLGASGPARPTRAACGRTATIDPLWLLVAGDALPPLTFNFGLLGWVPTVSLDMHLRTLPTGGWLKAVQRAQLIADNWLDETCDLYDETRAARRLGPPVRGLPRRLTRTVPASPAPTGVPLAQARQHRRSTSA